MVMAGVVGSGAISAAATLGPPRPLECMELTIPDAVLCSEMGVHFSPCGRYLAVCVACQVPVTADDDLFQGGIRQVVIALVLGVLIASCDACCNAC